MSRRLLFPFVVVAAAALFACSSTSSTADSDSPPENSSPPTIKDFVLTPTTLTVNKPTDLIGGLTIEDTDGDIAGVGGEIIGPDGRVVATIQDKDIPPDGQKTATVNINLPKFPAPRAGEYTVTFQARDQKGNQSVKASVTLTVTAQ